MFEDKADVVYHSTHNIRKRAAEEMEGVAAEVKGPRGRRTNDGGRCRASDASGLRCKNFLMLSEIDEKE